MAPGGVVGHAPAGGSADLPAFAVSGLSGAGKTRLICRLAWGWHQEGLTVVTAKHTPHGWDAAHRDRGRAHKSRPHWPDSSQHLAAGAEATLLVGPEGWRLERASGAPLEWAPPAPVDRKALPGVVAAWLAAHVPADRILLEGFKAGAVPRIWVEGVSVENRKPGGTQAHGGAATTPGVALGRAVAVVSRSWPHRSFSPAGDMPVFSPDNASGLASWLEDRLALARPPSFRLGATAAAAVMAGGGSRRMGHNKALATVGGMPMLERALWSTRACAESMLVTAEPEPYARWQRACVAEPEAGSGPLAGLEAALRAARQPTVVALACDLPLFPSEGVDQLLAALERHPEAVAAVATDGERRQPLCAAYRATAAATAAALLAAGERSMAALLDRIPVAAVPFPSTWLLNANTPAELERARRLACGTDGSNVPHGPV